MNDKTPRFTKLDAAGSPLAADAADWAAVLDNTTDLIWSKDDVGTDEIEFAAAKAAIEKFGLLGKSDWRLPTVEELFALADRTRFNPAIDTAFFPSTKSDWYWTGTPVASSPESYAWFVLFYYGGAYVLHRGNTAFVRAVRSARASQ